MNSEAEHRSAKRRLVACLHCREKKVRCDGSHPCGYCSTRNIECIFPNKTHRRRPIQTLRPADNRESGPFAVSAETSRANGSANRGLIGPSHHGRRAGVISYDRMRYDPPLPRPTARVPNSISPDGSRNGGPGLTLGVASQNATFAGTSTSDLTLGWGADDGYIASEALVETSIGDEEPLNESRPSESWAAREYHGDSSIFSICSTAAIDWIVRQTHNTSYADLSAEIETKIGSQLKMGQSFSQKRAPEPEFETAWRYYEAYFQIADSAFRVISRPAFEARLRDTFRYGNEAVDDPAWYALRNAVYAAGKRQVLNNDPRQLSFFSIQSQCWLYFENAMSVYTDILFSRPTIMGVRALIAMAMFVEGLGSPCLEYILCASASRLAQSQGLHRQPPRDWKLSPAELSERSVLFWTIYAYDKHIAIRTGKPSAIDDNDITCAVPAFQNSRELEGIWLTKVIEHARLSSKVALWLSKFRSKHRTLEESILKLRDINDRLTSWAKSLPAPLRPNTGLKRLAATSTKLHINQIIYTHYGFHGTVMALNSPLAWPWLLKEDICRSQSQKSTLLVINAARAIINLTHFIEIDCSTPLWLSFYYPFTAMINLFIHVIRFPRLPTVKTDLSLLDVVTGYFGRVEVVTASSVSFSFVYELSQYAHDAVTRNRASQAPSNPSAAVSGRDTMEQMAASSTGRPSSLDIELGLDCLSTPEADTHHARGIQIQNEACDYPDFLNLDVGDYFLDSMESDLLE